MHQFHKWIFFWTCMSHCMCFSQCPSLLHHCPNAKKSTQLGVVQLKVKFLEQPAQGQSKGFLHSNWAVWASGCARIASRANISRSLRIVLHFFEVVLEALQMKGMLTLHHDDKEPKLHVTTTKLASNWWEAHISQTGVHPALACWQIQSIKLIRNFHSTSWISESHRKRWCLVRCGTERCPWLCWLLWISIIQKSIVMKWHIIFCDSMNCVELEAWAKCMIKTFWFRVFQVWSLMLQGEAKEHQLCT